MRTVFVLLFVFLGWTLFGTRGHRPALTVSGSTALLPAARRAAAVMARRGVRVEILAGGSLFGLSQVQAGAVTIALSEVPPPPGLWALPLGSLPVTVVTRTGRGGRSVGMDQVAALLSGAVTDWSVLGGRPGPIVVVFRTSPSGLRMALVDRLLGGTAPLLRSVNALSNGDVLAGVRSTPGALGFLEGKVPPRVAVLRVEGALPGRPGYPLVIRTYAVLRRPPGPRAEAFLRALQAALAS